MAWGEFHADVQASLRKDPAGPKAQALVARAERLIEDFTGGAPNILQGLQAMMADRADWPKDVKADSRISPEGEAFLKKAKEAAKLAQVR